MTLTFDETLHRYTLDGVEVPSVTGVLKRAGLIDFSAIPIHTLAVALERGRVVHQALHYYNEHDLDVEQFARDFPEWAGYVRGWITFCEQRHFVPMLSEYRVASRRHQFAGTADCFGELDGLGVLVDFATGRPQDVSKDLQTAAYLALAHESALEDPILAAFLDAHPVVRRYAVALRKDGGFTLHAYDNAGDFRTFLTLLDAQRIVAARRAERAEVAA
jgi:hypothetical protein